MKFPSLLLLLLGFFISYGSGQEISPALKIISIERIEPIVVAGIPHDRRITFSLSNPTRKEITVFGRYVNGLFDPSGNNWSVDLNTGKVVYYHDESSALLKWKSRFYIDRKVLKPGEELILKEIDSTGDPRLQRKSYIWLQIGKSKRIQVFSDWYPNGLGKQEK